MGAGQIGGIATLLDIDFKNAAGFIGEPALAIEGQHIVHYLSHAMMFCVGVLLEAHVVLTPAICVFGERYKFSVYAGTHKFLDGPGISRQVNHLCIHKGYNHTMRWSECSPDNLAILVLSQQFSFNKREEASDFVLNRVRYGNPGAVKTHVGDTSCHYFGWGSRRNGYLIPLLIDLLRVDVTLLPPERCLEMWNNQDKYLCIQQPPCRTERHGVLCPDDLGSVLVCSGYAVGMMSSRLIDRPCGVGFLDLNQYNKFLSCAVDDSRDVINNDDDFGSFGFSRIKVAASTPSLATVDANETIDEA